MEEEAASEPIVTPAVRICHQYAFTDYSEVIQPPLSVLHAALLSATRKPSPVGRISI